jgi:hypothetical protein
MKIRIDDVVKTLMFIDGSIYLEIDSQEHLEEVIEHLETMWEVFEEN